MMPGTPGTGTRAPPRRPTSSPPAVRARRRRRRSRPRAAGSRLSGRSPRRRRRGPLAWPAILAHTARPMPAAARTLASLHRWPVKSMAGEEVDALRLDARGAGGDRAQSLFDVFGRERRRLTVRQLPRMLSWAAAYPDAPGARLDPNAPPLPIVTAPDGRAFAWDDPALATALRDDLGRDVTLERDLALMPDLPDSLLVTVEASRAGLEAELGRPIDLRRFRPNLHLRLDAPAFAEEGWAGRRLHVGDAELELLHPCERCAIPTRDPETTQKWPELLRWLAAEHDTLFGINARALRPATVRVGDAVVVA